MNVDVIPEHNMGFLKGNLVIFTQQKVGHTARVSFLDKLNHLKITKLYQKEQIFVVT